MPKLRNVGKLEDLSLHSLSGILCGGFSKLERSGDDDGDGDCCCISRYLSLLPSSLMETLIPLILGSITGSMRENRSHKGLLTALKILLKNEWLHKLDIGALFSGVRLYGRLNSEIKRTIKESLKENLMNLTSLNLSSKCDDLILIELAKYCRELVELNVPLSDVSDKGLLALCGISIDGSIDPEFDGCRKLVKCGLLNCNGISISGVGCLIRNLSALKYVYYDKCVDALDNVTKIDGDFITGRKPNLQLTHLDQFGDYYEFESHPDIIDILLKVCPHLNSLRFFTSDGGFKELSRLPNIKYVQLETEESLSNGFYTLVEKFSSSLVSLTLTFRYMTHEHLKNIGENLIHLQSLKLTGFLVENSRLLSPSKSNFLKLRQLDVRMVKQENMSLEFNDEDEEDGDEDTITTELLRYLTEFSFNLEEIAIAGIASFVNQDLIMDIISKLSKIKKFSFSTSPSSSLTFNLAKKVIEKLENLEYIALSKWKISSKDIKALTTYLRTNNIDLNLG